MKVTLYMAMSANNMIARENGDEDFLSHENWITFTNLAESFGCFIIGRKTYDVVKKWEDYNFDDIKSKKIIVTKNTKFKAPKGYTSVKSPADGIEKAGQFGFKNVLLTGGAQINSAFMKAGLVDEVILNIEPTIIGKGISLFSEDNFESKLSLVNIKKLVQIVQLHYKVLK